jgi:protein arginine N-methyltransferase 5
MDHLQSTTYETFEQDPVKYKNYEEVLIVLFVSCPCLTPPLQAMYRALVEWPKMERM